MKTAVLTFTRGNERKIFKPQLDRNIAHQIGKIDEHIIIDYPPKNDRPDLWERFKEGVIEAHEKGVEWLYIFEDDDYYKEAHSLVLSPKSDEDIRGVSMSIYYHIMKRGYKIIKHENRSSLYNTAFKPSAILPFLEQDENTVFVDIELWKYARKKLKCSFADSITSLGIKHGLGVCGGIGHKMNSYTPDSHMIFFGKHVDKASKRFYEDISK